MMQDEKEKIWEGAKKNDVIYEQPQNAVVA